MTVYTERKPFVADAVFIPDSSRWSDSLGEHVDPTDCVKLLVNGDNNSAEVYTEEAWNNDGQPLCRREWGEFTVVEGGKVELLPELWVVKIDERQYWLDPDVLANCPRIYGVYVVDRKQHFHLCSFEASYELHFIGSQWEEIEAIQDDEHKRSQIFDKISEGDGLSEPVTYWSARDIDRMLETECKAGFLPPEVKNGGYKLDGIESVTPDDAYEEARESHCQLEL